MSSHTPRVLQVAMHVACCVLRTACNMRSSLPSVLRYTDTILRFAKTIRGDVQELLLGKQGGSTPPSVAPGLPSPASRSLRAPSTLFCPVVRLSSPLPSLRHPEHPESVVCAAPRSPSCPPAAGVAIDSVPRRIVWRLNDSLRLAIRVRTPQPKPGSASAARSSTMLAHQ